MSPNDALVIACPRFTKRTASAPPVSRFDHSCVPIGSIAEPVGPLSVQHTREVHARWQGWACGGHIVPAQGASRKWKGGACTKRMALMRVIDEYGAMELE
jgi:hypothetical protein